MENPEESLIPASTFKWHPLVEGIDFALLFSSRETGRWRVMLRCQAGCSFGIHKHFGAGEYFVVKGRLEYRMGTAEQGTYGYEPLGVIHEYTHFPIYTELLYGNDGPIAFLDDKGEVKSMLDSALLEQLVAQH